MHASVHRQSNTQLSAYTYTYFMCGLNFTKQALPYHRHKDKKRTVKPQKQSFFIANSTQPALRPNIGPFSVRTGTFSFFFFPRLPAGHLSRCIILWILGARKTFFGWYFRPAKEFKIKILGFIRSPLFFQFSCSFSRIFTYNLSVCSSFLFIHS